MQVNDQNQIDALKRELGAVEVPALEAIAPSEQAKLELPDANAEAKAQELLRKGKEDLQRMYAELKKTLKPLSKNELIRMVGACLIDNYVLKTELQRLNGVLNAQVNVNPGGHGGVGGPGVGDGTSPSERASEPEQQ